MMVHQCMVYSHTCMNRTGPKTTHPTNMMSQALFSWNDNIQHVSVQEVMLAAVAQSTFLYSTEVPCRLKCFKSSIVFLVSERTGCELSVHVHNSVKSSGACRDTCVQP